MKGSSGEAIVVVRRQWNDWRRARYRLVDIDRVFWDFESGGIRMPSPQAFLYTKVDCQGMLDGEVGHSGAHGECPHTIRVCIVKKDNDQKVFGALARQAGPRPEVTQFELGTTAQEIVAALRAGAAHPCLSKKAGLWIVNPMKLPGLADGGLQTVSGRSKRLKAQIRRLMASIDEFEETRYRQMLAYRRRGDRA